MKSGLHMTTADRILIASLVVLSAVLFFVLPGTVLSGGTTVEITACGRDAGTYPLNEDRVVEVKGARGTTVVEIHEGRVRVKSSCCPNKICVGMGAKGREGGVIVCIPNEVVVKVGSSQPQGLDAVSR